MRRLAFTLIELLVVIAIVLILAAILFPVYGRAKEAARQSVCVSSLRQIGQASQLYLADCDERFFPLVVQGNSGETNPNNFGFFRWPWLVLPYAGDMNLFVCPSDTKAPNYRDPAHEYFGYLFGLMPSWGYNAHYLSPGVDPLLPDEAPFLPRRAAEATSPSQTVFFVESTWYTGTEPEAGYYRVYPPDQWAGAPPYNGFSYGHCWPRHGGTIANVLFLDGHAKGLTMGKLSDQALWRLSGE